MILKIDNSHDTRSDKEILDEINYESSTLPYLPHRTIQENLCEIERRLPKHGHWTIRDDTMYAYECPFCKYLHQYKGNYCTLCGAKMDEVSE